MCSKFKIILISTLFGFSLALIFTHTKYAEWRQVSQLENTREVAVLEPAFDYKESDNPLFYSSDELVTFMIEDLEETEEKEEQDETLALIQQICPYVKVDTHGIRIPKVEVPALEPTPLTNPSPTVENTQYQNMIDDLMTQAERCLGTPYVWGGTTIGKGMDCSGFVQYIYKQIGFTLPRVSADQSKVGKLVKRNELKPGDLLFFDTRNYRDKSDIKTPDSEAEYAAQIASGLVPNTVSHVGMYVGNGQMIHASSGHGYVTYESVEKDYYKVRFINARRLIKDN